MLWCWWEAQQPGQLVPTAHDIYIIVRIITEGGQTIIYLALICY